MNRQAIGWGIAFLVLLLILWGLGTVVTPFLIGAGCAYLLDPVADWLQRRGMSRIWAVVLITLCLIIAFATALILIIPLLARQFSQLVETAPEMISKAEAYISLRFPKFALESSTVREAVSNMGQLISDKGAALVSTVLGSVVSVVSFVALIVIVPVVAFYMLLDWDHMVRVLDDLVPRQHLHTIRALAAEIDATLSGFLRGQGLVIFILACFYSVSLWLVGLPFGFAIGVLAASLSFIPYVGVVIGGATAIGVALFAFWGEPFKIGGVIAIFAAGQAVEGNYLQPKIVGDRVGLHPVWLMLSLAVFGSLLGFVGLLVAVPIAASIGVLVRFSVARYKESAVYTGADIAVVKPDPILVEIVPPGSLARHRADGDGVTDPSHPTEDL